MQNILFIAAASALPQYGNQQQQPAYTQQPAQQPTGYSGSPLQILGLGSGIIQLPRIGAAVGNVLGGLPLVSNIFGQGYNIPNGNSYLGGFTTNGPGVIGGGVTGAYKVDNGDGNKAKGNGYVASMDSTPVVDGKQVNVHEDISGGHDEQSYVVPGGQGYSTSSSLSYSSQSH